MLLSWHWHWVWCCPVLRKMVVLHHLHQKKQIHQVHNPSLSALALLRNLVMPSSGTSNFNRRGIMKKSILIILASIFLSYPMNLLGLDSETPHELKSGDTISADMFNEIFDYINNANKMITASDLIGTWSCEFYKQRGWWMWSSNRRRNSFHSWY